MTHAFPKRRTSDLRNPPDGIDVRQNLGRAGFACHDIVFDALHANAEQRRGKADLVAIARNGVFVKDQLVGHSVIPAKAGTHLRRLPAGQRLRSKNKSRQSGLAFSIRRSEEHTSELQSLMRISYAVFCLKKKKKQKSSM